MKKTDYIGPMLLQKTGCEGQKWFGDTEQAVQRVPHLPNVQGCLYGSYLSQDISLDEADSGATVLGNSVSRDTTIIWGIYFLNGERKQEAEVVCIFGGFEDAKR